VLLQPGAVAGVALFRWGLDAHFNAAGQYTHWPPHSAAPVTGPSHWGHRLAVAPAENLWRKACSSDTEVLNLICEPPEPCSVGTPRPVRPLCYLYHAAPGVIGVVSTIAAAQLHHCDIGMHPWTSSWAALHKRGDVCQTCDITNLCSGSYAMCVLNTLLQLAGQTSCHVNS
jgi:hypothetical protein